MTRSRKAGLLLKPQNASRIGINYSSTIRSSHPDTLVCHSLIRRQTQHPRNFLTKEYCMLSQSARYNAVEYRLNRKALQQLQRNLHVDRTSQINNSTESFTEWIWKQVKVPKGFENFFPKGAAKPKSSKSSSGSKDAKGATSKKTLPRPKNLLKQIPKNPTILLLEISGTLVNVVLVEAAVVAADKIMVTICNSEV